MDTEIDLTQYPNESYIEGSNYRVAFPHNIGVPTILLLGSKNLCDVKETLISHRHINILEIVYIHKGNQIYEMDGLEYHLYGGDVFITPPNIEHSTACYRVDKSSFVWIHLDMTPSANFLGLNAEYGFILYQRLLSFKKPVIRGCAKMKKLIDNAISVASTNDSLKKLKLQQLVLEFLLEIIECDDDNNSSKISDEIDNALQYMNSNFLKNIDIKMLAKQSCLSESRFRQKFKSEIGVPPQEYICRKRMLYSQNLIEQNLSFGKIAEILLFENAAYFSRVFKKYYNITPTEYKKSLKTSLDCSPPPKETPPSIL